MLRKLAVAILPCLIMTLGAGFFQGWSAAGYTFLGCLAGLLGLWLWQLRSNKSTRPSP